MLGETEKELMVSCAYFEDGMVEIEAKEAFDRSYFLYNPLCMECKACVPVEGGVMEETVDCKACGNLISCEACLQVEG